MKWINAEQQVTVTIYDEEHEEHLDKIMTVEEMLDTYTNEGCPTMYSNPEQKKGKWIGEPNRAHCSVCKVENYYAYKYDSDSGLYVQQDFFCPNCGADLRGERDDSISD